MINNNQLNKKQSILGCLPKAALLNLGLGALVLIISAILGGPKMAFGNKTVLILFFTLMAGYFGVTIWSIVSLMPKKIAGQLQTRGPYKFVRHPMYGAIIFFLNPALSFLLRSWLLFLACLPIYFIWRQAIQGEEKELIEVFGEEYLKYKRTIWSFFPNLLKINKPVFFVATGLAVFVITFIILNFPSFYLRAVEWQRAEPLEKINPKPTRGLPVGRINFPSDQPKYNQPDSIIIEKINVEAPLVPSPGTSQKELNQALNEGVVIYPGSQLPGQAGNVFLSGHSSSYPWNKTEYGQVFALLDKLEPGDIITIYYNQSRYVYQVTKKYVTTPDKVTIGSGSQAKTLTLSTCWPIGTTWRRLLVEAVQIE